MTRRTRRDVRRRLKGVEEPTVDGYPTVSLAVVASGG